MCFFHISTLIVDQLTPFQINFKIWPVRRLGRIVSVRFSRVIARTDCAHANIRPFRAELI